MRHYGVIGFPLEHSFSPDYFNKKFEQQNISDADYAAFPLRSINDLKKIIEEKKLQGFNVTIPYKEKIISNLDSLENESKEIGAVNCVKIENGKLVGYNTDALGFEISLNELLTGSHNNALVLGRGGASRAIKFVLKKKGLSFKSVTREKSSGDFLWSELNKKIISEHTLIINCTPLGMMPNEKSFPPIPYESLSENHFLFDLVYNPAETQFMKKGIEYGAKVCNGLRMLQIQADKSWEIWNR